MPQGDLVLASNGGPCNGKIDCETQLTAGDPPEDGGRNDPDSPPESFWLSKDAEFDWFDRNAFYERKESTKGMTPNSTNINPAINNPTNSQRFPAPSNLKSKASIIGLPKTQKHGLDPKNRRNCKPRNSHLFPKQSRPAGKSGQGQSLIEPSSPKVSCMGRVRSKKDSDRRRSLPCDEPASRRKSGFFSSCRALLRSGCRDGRAISVHAPVAASPVRRSSAELKAHDIRERLPASQVVDGPEDSVPRRSSVDGEPPGLGGMMRFTSGRRSDSWVNSEQ